MSRGGMVTLWKEGKPSPRIGLTAGQGPDDVVHWVWFDDFRLLRLAAAEGAERELYFYFSGHGSMSAADAKSTWNATARRPRASTAWTVVLAASARSR